MALIDIPIHGLIWPAAVGGYVPGTGITLDATGEKAAMIGRLFIKGRPAAAKTLDTTGSSAISFQISGNGVFDNASSSIEIGIQGVATGVGPRARPDGTFTVKSVVTTAADTSPALTTNLSPWITATPTTGTASLSHGDLIAVVFDFTNRAGTDAITLLTTGGMLGATYHLPVNNTFLASAWDGTGAGTGPNVVITFSDGTLGIIDCAWVGNSVADIWNNATNPDERGNIFQIPFDCKVDALVCTMRVADGNGQFTQTLYSDPEGTPVALASVSVEQGNSINAERLTILTLASEISLSANTDYCIAVRATGTGNLRQNACLVGDAAHRIFIGAGGTTMRSVTRDGGSGAFGSSSTTKIFPTSVRISQIQDGTGGGTTIAGTPMRRGMV